MTKIGEIVRDGKGERLISEEDVQTKFKTLLPEFRPNGLRFNDYLYCFAGKDLLYAMRAKLQEWGFEPPASSNLSPEEFFVEKVVSRIERLDNVWEWLPEWKTLRQWIEKTEFLE